MNETKNTAKYIIIALCALVVALLIAVAFLLGQRSGEKKNGGSDPAAPNVISTAEQSETRVSEIPHSTAPAQTAAPAQTTYPATEPPVTQASAETPRSLDINMSSGSLTITEGSAFDIRYDSSVIRAELSGETMEIDNIYPHPTASQRRRMDVTITVPYEYTFENVDIECGAGKLIVHTLRAETLDLELGAGSAVFNDLYVTSSAEIQEGAGELAIKSGELANLTLQCGAGATRVAAALSGINRVDAAVGAVDLDFKGSEADYTVAFQMGLGACYYNNEKIARSGSFGEGPTVVDINGGFGVMRVNVG